jgi:hypothetical protein
MNAQEKINKIVDATQDEFLARHGAVLYLIAIWGAFICGNWVFDIPILTPIVQAIATLVPPKIGWILFGLSVAYGWYCNQMAEKAEARHNFFKNS